MGTCKQEVGPRSYLVQCRSKIYPCYCQQLRTTPREKVYRYPLGTCMIYTEAEDTSDEDKDIENPVDLGSTIANGDTASSNKE